jgi:isopenicillin N synthase-like dioxygenase
MARAMAETRAFFDLPLGERLDLDKAKAAGVRGYERLGGQTLEPGTLADLKEGFYIGPEVEAAADGADPFDPRPNLWPPGRPSFRLAMIAYHGALLAVSRRVMAGLALSLGLDEAAFDAFCTDPIATVRLLHYPPQESAQAGRGAGAHTDFGALTLLFQDEAGGLEVYDPAAEAWTDTEPVRGAFVVNLGDLTERWTNGRYRSTRHRVVNRSGRRRYSIPFFLSGAPDYVVSCLQTCLDPGEAPQYPPTTVRNHLKERYRQTYGP